MRILHKDIIRQALIYLLVVVCAMLLFYLLHRYDNKYTAPGPSARNGTLTINEETGPPVIWLIDGWEYYGGRLLTPEDFLYNPPGPDQIIYIGQYGGFEAGDPAAEPHGSASYRMTIHIPEEKRGYLLYLPVIYSAYTLYINGALKFTMGNPDPDNFAPQTNERLAFMEAGEAVEILIAVSDFSHMYSGMIYPPAFGEPDAIYSMVKRRGIFNAGVVAAAFIIGLISLLIGLLYRRNSLWLMYSLICLSLLGYVSSPVMRAVGFYHSYMIESVSFCGMFVLVMMLQRKLCKPPKDFSLYFIVFGILVGAISVAFHILLPNMGLDAMLAYSMLIAAYKWLSALAIVLAGAFAVLQKGENKVSSQGIMCGILVFSAALIMDRLFPMYDPILFGWYVDIAGFILVLIIGGTISVEVHSQYVNALLLEEDVRATNRLLSLQTGHYESMLTNISSEREIRHDFRHHITVINEYLRQGKFEELATYINEIAGSIPDLEHIYCENTAVNAVVGYYLAKAKVSGVSVSASIFVPDKIGVKDTDLCIIFGNCLENAVEACCRQTGGSKFIKLNARLHGPVFAVKIENSFNGEYKAGNGEILSTKCEWRGIGLSSVAATVNKYSGSAKYEADNFVFTSNIILYSQSSGASIKN